MEKRKRSNEGTGTKRSARASNDAARRVGELLETLKGHKVLSYKGDGIELVISPMAYMDETIGMTGMTANEINKQVEESDLFYSARN